jgi:hypothetical protein
MITKEIENLIGAVPALRKIIASTRFPIAQICGKDNKIEETLAKAVWVVVPIQYYVLIQFSGGSRHFAAAAVAALLCVLAVVVVGSLIAILTLRDRSAYEERARKWSVALVSIWSITLLLLAASYFLASTDAQSRDLVYLLACKFLSCSDYPAVGLDTLLIYWIYAAVGTGIICFIVKFAARDSYGYGSSSDGFIMSTFVVSLIVAAVMMVVHYSSRVVITSLP